MHSGIIIPQTYKTHKPSYEARISLLTIPATSHAIPENDRETNALYGGAVHITKLYSRTRSFLHLVASSSRNFRELCNPEILRASTSPTKFYALEQQLCRSIDSNDAARFPPVSRFPWDSRLCTARTCPVISWTSRSLVKRQNSARSRDGIVRKIRNERAKRLAERSVISSCDIRVHDVCKTP